MPNAHELQSTSPEAVAQIISGVVQQIAMQPKKLTTSLRPLTTGYVLSISLAQEDFAYIVNTNGRTVKALNTMTATFSAKCGHTIELELLPH
jgi:predicted RNA-binding protein YlqC (UPF0109 family)